MRVLLAVERYFGDVRGGAYRVAWDCAQQLSQMGHAITLLSENPGPHVETETVQGVHLLRYRLGRRGLNVVAERRKAAAALLKNQFAEAPDLIWGHSPFQHLGALDAFPAVRSAYTVHSPIVDEIFSNETHHSLTAFAKARAAKHYEKSCLDRASAVLVLSAFTARLLTEHYGDRYAQRTIVAPGWTEVKKFSDLSSKTQLRHELGWRDDVPVLFTLRRMVPRMGLRELIAAAAVLHSAGAAFGLYIGGVGDMSYALQEQIKREGLQRIVTLTGAVSEQQLPHAYAACDAFVIPTQALECFGLIAVEAMAAGVPVLSTPVGALPEVIGPFEPEWLAKGKSPKDIAALLTKFLCGELRSHDAEQIRAYASAKYDLPIACKHFCEAALNAARPKL